MRIICFSLLRKTPFSQNSLGNCSEREVSEGRHIDSPESSSGITAERNEDAEIDTENIEKEFRVHESSL